MQYFPAALQNLADRFARLPGIGGKTAQRLAFHVLELRCTNNFTMEVVNKPEILAMIGQKASTKLGRPVRVIAVDKNAKPSTNKKLEELLSFGRSHADVITIRNNE